MKPTEAGPASAATEYVRRLDPDARRRLATALGVPDRIAEREEAPGAIAAAAADPSRAFALLASLSQDARDVLFMALAGEVLFFEPELTERARWMFAWRRERTLVAQQALEGASLLHMGDRYDDPTRVFGALHASLGPSLVPWAAGAIPGAPRVVPLAHRMALLLAYARAAPPRTTREGLLHQHWSDKAADRFAALGGSLTLTSQCVRFLEDVGVLAPGRSEGQRQHLMVTGNGVGALSLPPEELALAVVHGGDPSRWGSTISVLAAFERCRRDGRNGAIAFVDLLAAAKACSPQERWSMPTIPEHQLRPVAFADALGALRMLGLATVEVEGGVLLATRLVPAAAPSAGRGGAAAPRPKWVVQPNFEVLVPEGADPVGVARLGAVADLESADLVTRFTLSRESVARAATLPGGAKPEVEALAAGAEHGLPENVAATLLDWARRAAALRAFTGSVLVTGSEEQAAFLRARADTRREIAPGVFFLATSDLAKTLRDASKAGHAAPPVESDAPDYSAQWRTVKDPKGEAQALRTRVDEIAKAPAPPPPPPARRTKPPQGTGTVSDLRARMDALTAFARKWPSVLDAAKSDVDLIARALDLPDDVLEHVEAERFPARIRAALREAVEDHEAAVRAGMDPRPSAASSPAPRPPPSPPPAPPASPAVDLCDENPWSTPAPGQLRQFLTSAIELGTEVDLLYVNSDGRRAEHRVRPKRIVRDLGLEWIVAFDVSSSGICRYHLDRIAAVRERCP